MDKLFYCTRGTLLKSSIIVLDLFFPGCVIISIVMNNDNYWSLCFELRPHKALKLKGQRVHTN